MEHRAAMEKAMQRIPDDFPDSYYELWPGTESIDIMRSVLTKEEFIGFLKGNILKYRHRAGKKGVAGPDIHKANEYERMLRETLDD